MFGIAASHQFGLLQTDLFFEDSAGTLQVAWATESGGAWGAESPCEGPARRRPAGPARNC